MIEEFNNVIENAIFKELESKPIIELVVAL